jgi:tripartite-type tricarboxylate transporter receptor subunit TctC
MSKASMSNSLTSLFLSRRRFVALCALASGSAALVLNPGQGFAQSAAPANWPTQSVKLVVPAPAGSTTDALARMLAEQLGKKWKTTTIVENIAGAGMNIGARTVARATPDGYVLFVSPPSPLSFNHLLYKDLGYDPAQFTPITLLATIPNALVVRKTLPVNDLKDLIAFAKANPGKLSYGSGGVGTTPHLSAVQLETRAGVKLVHVPYRGTAPAMTDLVAGHIDVFFDTLSATVPLARGGEVKMIAIADSKRTPAYPDAPTLEESGLPGFKSVTWFGLAAPPGTPSALAARIHRDVAEVLESSQAQDFMRRTSLVAGGQSPEEAAKFFASEAKLWGELIREAKLEPQ